jgi:hypothetical protein
MEIVSVLEDPSLGEMIKKIFALAGPNTVSVFLEMFIELVNILFIGHY